MPQLHISKVAVACANLDTLRRRQATRAVGGVVPVYTRFRPKRAEELIGGSIYWIIKHNVAARQTILSFDVDAESRKTIIRINAELVRVAPQPRRAHQGWRYLGAEDAPSDLDESSDALAALPPALVTQLVSLALI
jgi:hypothetical protein